MSPASRRVALTFLQQEAQVHALQVTAIHRHPDLCVLHQSAVEPVLVVKEEVLQTHGHVA